MLGLQAEEHAPSFLLLRASPHLHGALYFKLNNDISFITAVTIKLGGLPSQNTKELEIKAYLANVCATMFASLLQCCSEMFPILDAI